MKYHFVSALLLLTVVPFGSGLECYCAGGRCPFDMETGTCITSDNGSCFSAVEEIVNEDTGEFELERSFGCLSNESGNLMQCKVAKDPHLHGKNIICCNSNHCNKELFPIHVPRNVTVELPQPNPIADNWHFLLIGLLVILFPVLCAAIYCMHKKKIKDKKANKGLLDSIDTNVSPMHGLLTDSTTGSGSGAGNKLLKLRTIAKQIQLVEILSKGRFSEVWLAKLQDRNVAVKMYPTQSEASCYREIEIFQKVIMRHKNILGFIAADIRTHGSQPFKIVITEYHQQGSLYEYLQNHALNSEVLKILAVSLASGLCHLHSEINGKPGKISVAHRDLTSKNILVNDNDECVIGDFALAGMIDSITRDTDIYPNERLPTIRYMAPEMLMNKLNENDYHAHLKCDIYSFGLVLWEMCRRCKATNPNDKSDICSEYSLPYQDIIPFEPTIEKMIEIVYTDQIRPAIPDHWCQEETLQELSKIMQECWKTKPDARLTSQNVKKKLYKLLKSEDDEIDYVVNMVY